MVGAQKVPGELGVARSLDLVGRSWELVDLFALLHVAAMGMRDEEDLSCFALDGLSHVLGSECAPVPCFARDRLSHVLCCEYVLVWPWVDYGC